MSELIAIFVGRINAITMFYTSHNSLNITTLYLASSQNPADRETSFFVPDALFAFHMSSPDRGGT